MVKHVSCKSGSILLHIKSAYHLSEVLKFNACIIKSNENEKSLNFLYFFLYLFFKCLVFPYVFVWLWLYALIKLRRSVGISPVDHQENVYKMCTMFWARFLFCFILICFVQHFPVCILGISVLLFWTFKTFLNSTNASLGKTIHPALGNGIPMHVHVWSVQPLSPSHSTWRCDILFFPSSFFYSLPKLPVSPCSLIWKWLRLSVFEMTTVKEIGIFLNLCICLPFCKNNKEILL